MIPATPGRPENKAVIEDKFGKFEQAVRTINLDDSTPDNLVKSAVEEVVRAYTADINHAVDGIGRMQALKSACPDPEKDRAFLGNLKARQDLIRKPDCLPTMNVARQILDQGSLISKSTILIPKVPCGHGSVPDTPRKPFVRHWSSSPRSGANDD